ncbi:2-oxoglutarate/2-oxoacid ferredoxin oxidoreductase, beta subunit [Brevinematales bacterium NS]|jgi:2-oxoglutarate ferredoxin oxidoreductase subunit beta|nr:2-oxoglutarate oxidoreductase [Brevinematales bacterium]QJR21240.1 2-oxoglutarate/2-oxoacid ferredoxin oxidoreductase, beta subunit [Brevinematales bacterium NS]
MATKVIFDKPKSMKDVPMHYCPGCGHGVIHRVICEAIDELGLRDKAIGVAPVGCAVLAYDYWDFDVSEAAHGRAAAVATGIKRVWPDRLVISYQGDGDLASIGMGETIHAANRGENITVIFVNNANYGMTGGQMAPTTLVGQKTPTTPNGRDPSTMGFPIRMAEMLAAFPAVRYSVRTTVADFKGVVQTKMAIKKAFELQMKGEGYTFVEILSNCNTNWEMSPREANTFILEKMVETFPLGTFKDERTL